MTSPSSTTSPTSTATDAAALNRALEWLRGQQAKMESLLERLVNISSHTPNIDGCDQVAHALYDELMALGKGALAGGLGQGPSGRYGAHLSVSTAKQDGVTLLVGHHDTVFPAATFFGFRRDPDGSTLRGPGVLDMKGGLVVMAYALGALAEAGVLAERAITLISVSDEEVGSPEGQEVIVHAAQAGGAKAALVFESGRAEDRLITRRKGTGGITVKATGKAAHAGNLHHEGANAIWALARFIDAAQKLTDYGRGITVNVGKVSGGMGKNTVPDQAECQLDFRFIDQASGEALVEAIERAATEAAAAVPGTALTVEGGILRAPLERTAASRALYEAYAACHRAEGLGTEEAALLGGGSDANTTAALGIPSIDGLGPRGKGFHTVDEFIERATLVSKAAALVRYLHAHA